MLKLFLFFLLVQSSSMEKLHSRAMFESDSPQIVNLKHMIQEWQHEADQIYPVSTSTVDELVARSTYYRKKVKLRLESGTRRY